MNLAGWIGRPSARATRVRRCSVTETPGRVTFTREVECPGMVHVVQRVILSAYDSILGLEVDMEMIPNASPQGIYFSFPLKLDDGWHAAYDTAGTFVRVDDDQLPGACRNWVCSETMVTMWDDRSGVALLLPDAPTVQFGDFHFGPPLEALPRPKDPLLLAWPVNNYWDTNTPRVQSGRIQLRYGLVTYSKFDLPMLRKRAEIFRQPVLVWPITGGGRGRDEGRLR